MFNRTLVLAAGMLAASLGQAAAQGNLLPPFLGEDRLPSNRGLDRPNDRRGDEDRRLDDRRQERERAQDQNRSQDNRSQENRGQDNRGGNQDIARRQQQYNTNIVALQQQHNQRLLSLQQQFQQGRINRGQLDQGQRQLDDQYNQSVANEQRALPR